LIEIFTRGQFHEHKLGGKIPSGKICPKFGGKEKFHQVKNFYFMGKKQVGGIPPRKISAKRIDIFCSDTA
jgi:hypothetical protein